MTDTTVPTIPAGTRIRLTDMPNDPNPIPVGTTGTVIGVRDLTAVRMGWQIDVDWDTDHHLFLVPGDTYDIIDHKIPATKIEFPFSEAPRTLLGPFTGPD